MINLPALPGAYVLEFYLPQATELVIGCLGRMRFPAGAGFYLGSARGPGGLKARLGRHVQPGKIDRPHWHIDYLHGFAQVLAAAYLVQLDSALATPLECQWSQALAELPGACVPLAGFGASDCRLGCMAHLVAFAGEQNDNHPLLGRSGWLRLLSDAAGMPLTNVRLLV